MPVFPLSGNKLLHCTAHVFVVAEIAVRSEKRNAVCFAYVGALQQHIHRGCVGQQLCLVIANSVCMVVITNVVMIVSAKGVEWCVVTQHAFVAASVFTKQGNAVIAKSNNRWVSFFDVISIAINT